MDELFVIKLHLEEQLKDLLEDLRCEFKRSEELEELKKDKTEKAMEYGKIISLIITHKCNLSKIVGELEATKNSLKIVREAMEDSYNDCRIQDELAKERPIPVQYC